MPDEPKFTLTAGERAMILTKRENDKIRKQRWLVNHILEQARDFAIFLSHNETYANALFVFSSEEFYGYILPPGNHSLTVEDVYEAVKTTLLCVSGYVDGLKRSAGE